MTRDDNVLTLNQAADDWGPRRRRVKFREDGLEGLKLYGGPYTPDQFPDDVGCLLICLDARKAERFGADVVVEWPDFGLPERESDFRAAVASCLRALLYEGRQVYVGCGFGQGRTGTLLAVLSAVLRDERDALRAVSYVRRFYNSRAVETAAQADFVWTMLGNLDRPSRHWRVLRRRAALYRLAGRVRRLLRPGRGG